MEDFRERYKRVGLGREDISANRALRSQRRDEARRDARTEHFSLRRDMDISEDELKDNVADQDNEKMHQELGNHEEEDKKRAVEEKVQIQLQKLEKWREERNRRRLQEKKRAKPVFKVGVVHHRVYSPPLTKESIPPPPAKLCKSKEMHHHHNPEPTAIKRVTRATEKRLAIKAASSQKKKENLRTAILKRNEKVKSQVKRKIEMDEQVPLVPEDHQFKAPLGVTEIPMFGRQVLEATKSGNNALNSLDVSSTIKDFVKELSVTSDSNFQPKDQSLILSKSSSRQSNFNTSHCNPRSSSIGKINNYSLNNSSVEAVTLKLSSDDQEMLDDDENIDSNSKMNFSISEQTKSSKNPKRQSKVYNLSEAKVSEDQEMKELEDNENLSKNSSESIKSRKRSTRMFTNESQIRPSLSKSANFAKEKQQIKKSKSVNKRKSMKDFISSENNIPEKKIIVDQQMEIDTVENLFNASNNDSITTKQNYTKSPVTVRKSTRIIPERIENVKDGSFMHQDQKMLEDQENINYNNKNLIDYSISDLDNIPSPATRKSKRFVNDLQDQSLMKFSPRHSMRPTTLNSLNQVNICEATTDSPIKMTSESLEKISISKDEISTHNSSEPTKQRILEKNNSLSQSLNMSLPKDSSSDKPPVFFSPYIVASRGKDRVRKEVQRRRFSQRLPTEIPTKDTIMQNLNISVEEEERTAQYYKFILDKEIERLNELCERWNIVKEDTTTPEDIHYEIQAAVGQTQLLINKKFERFRGLVLDCETGKGEMLVTCKDLQGFWEMMYMEITDCDNRFNRLEEKKAKNWAMDESEELKMPKKKRNMATKKPVAKKKPVAGKSSLRAHIMAARKKKMGSNDNEIDIEVKETPIIEQNDRLLETTEVDPRDIGISSTNNRRSTSTPKSSKKWQSLLKKVQLSQTRKSTKSPLIVMKLSQMCKTPEIQLDDSIVYINSDRTPAKSILKSSKEELIGSVAKSTNKVFFKEEPSEFREFESNIENNNEQMCLDNINKSKEPIERRLDFESESFNSSHIEDEDEKNKIDSNEGLNIEENNGLQENNEYFDGSLQLKQTKHLYLNSRGIICEKIVPARQDTPRISLLKRSNSEAVRNTRSKKINDLETTTVPTTPRYKRKIPEILIDHPDTPVNEVIHKSKRSSVTPKRNRSTKIPEILIDHPDTPVNDVIIKSRKSSSSEADTTLTEYTANVSAENADSSILRKRTPRSSKMPKSSNVDLDESTRATVTLKRSISLNTAKSNITKKSLGESSAKVSTPKLRRKQSQKLQENVEPMEQEIEETVNNRIKVSRTSSIKRRNSKKYMDIVNDSQLQTDISSQNNISTPNTRRKSLRISRLNARTED